MREDADRKNGNPVLTVERGGLSPIRGRRRGRRPGVRVLTAAEAELERELRDSFVVLKGAKGTTPSRGIAAICCNDAHPWRALARRVLEALNAGARAEQVRAIGVRFLAWIDRQIALRDSPRWDRAA